MAKRKARGAVRCVRIVREICIRFDAARDYSPTSQTGFTQSGMLHALLQAIDFRVLKFMGFPEKSDGKPRGKFKPDKKLKDPMGTMRQRKRRAKKVSTEEA